MITTELIKQLRESSGAGMLDCKKALEASDGDIDKAIDWLREKGISKAAKKAERIAAEGLCNVAVDGNYAIIIELNSETDFVAKTDNFITLLNEVAEYSLKAHAKTVEEALNAKTKEGTLNDLIVAATSKIGEKLSLRRVELVEKTSKDTFGEYLHMGGKIASLLVLKNSDNAQVAKDVAMHVAALSPKYLRREDVPFEEINKEREIQQESLNNDEKLKDKPEAALVRIVDGRINKWMEEMCLLEQTFVKDSSMNVKKYFEENDATISYFVRYQVGEGMEKRKDNFAEEVYSQVGK